MKILIYGSAKPHRIEDSYKRAFLYLGHSVEIIDIDKSENHLSFYLNNRVLHRCLLNSYKIRKNGSKEWNHFVRLYLKDYDPDIFFVFKGDYLFPETLTEIKKKGIKVIIFNPDNPLPNNANFRPEHIPIAKKADYYFIWSRRTAEIINKKGVKNVKYLPFAWDPKVYPYIESNKPVYDVVFIGGWSKNREKILERVAQNFDLKIWGPDYWAIKTDSNSAVRKAWKGKSVIGEEASKIISRSKIVINILREQNLPDGTNMRTFEVPGAGGFQLSNFSIGAAQIYSDGLAGAYFKDDEYDLLNKIEYYLNHSNYRSSISSKAHNITAKNHTYIIRAKTILNTLIK